MSHSGCLRDQARVWSAFYQYTVTLPLAFSLIGCNCSDSIVVITNCSATDSHVSACCPQTSSAITQADEQQQQQHLLNEYVGKDECQQQCKSSIQHSASSVGHQQSISSSRAANRTEHDRPTGPLKAKEAGPPIKADGNATSSTAAWRGSSTATEISAPIPRYIGSLIADLDPQLIKNHWNKQKRGFSFRSKGPGVTSEGSPRSSAAADVGSARVGKSIVKP